MDRAEIMLRMGARSTAEWARRAAHEPRSAGGGYWPYAVLASALGNLGQTAEAREAVDEALRRKPDLSLALLETTLPTKHPGGLEPLLGSLHREVHGKASLLSADEILTAATGRPLDPDVFKAHLAARYLA